MSVKETEMNSTEIEFWDKRYRAGRTPWDFHGVPLALVEWLQRNEQLGRVLIPGCGSGYEVRVFADRGWDVLAVDFSPSAVQRAQIELGTLGKRVLLGDFFSADFGNRKFDLVYERTFLCSLSPGRWHDYARRVAKALKDGGKLIGFFYYGVENDPPPFPLSDEMAQSLFGTEFVRVEDEPVVDSLALFAGHERWHVWEKSSNKATLAAR